MSALDLSCSSWEELTAIKGTLDSDTQAVIEVFEKALKGDSFSTWVIFQVLEGKEDSLDHEEAILYLEELSRNIEAN